METYLTKSYGKNIVIDVPDCLNIPEGKEFVVMSNNDGAFTYIPLEKFGSENIDTLNKRKNDEEIEYDNKIWDRL